MTFVSVEEQQASKPSVDYVVTLSESLHLNASVQDMVVADAFSTGSYILMLDKDFHWFYKGLFWNDAPFMSPIFHVTLKFYKRMFLFDSAALHVLFVLGTFKLGIFSIL